MIKKSLLPLVILLVNLLILGCAPSSNIAQDGDDPVVVLGESSDPNTGVSGVSEFQIVIPANDLGVGTPRIPFIIMDGGSMVREVEQVFITVFDLSGDGPKAIWEGGATNYSDYAVPYWVFYPQIDAAGNYGMRADLLTETGESSQAQFAVAIQDDAIAPNVGDAGIGSNSPTGTGDELKLISSDTNPDVDLYQITLADALANGRPTVISFSTPSYCQTAICAPVLDSVKQLKDSNGGEADFVHIEIFADFETFETASTVLEWNLQSEPWTYVVDGNGTITARFAGPVSPSELEAALDEVQ